jgi:peptide deformylase
MSLPIVHYNDPVLRKKGAKVVLFDAALDAFAKEMIATMHEAGGIGLAAQQVGRAAMVCVVDLRASDADYDWQLDGRKPPRDLLMPMVLANPRVEPVRGSPDTTADEGCLSFPGIRGDVSRPDAVEVAYQDERGGAHRLVCTGLLSRCIQHEVDHLNGVLFIDRMDRKARSEVDADVRALAKQTRLESKG